MAVSVGGCYGCRSSGAGACYGGGSRLVPRCYEVGSVEIQIVVRRLDRPTDAVGRVHERQAVLTSPAFTPNGFGAQIQQTVLHQLGNGTMANSGE